jgi:hypothetical protein
MVLAAMPRPAFASQITSVSASGTGGTVTNLAIGTAFTTNDSIAFKANFTATAPINFAITVNGAGNFDLGYPVDQVTNSTGHAWPTFTMNLLGAPAGSTMNQFSFDTGVFSGGTYTPPFPNATSLKLAGGTGVLNGHNADLSVGFNIVSAASFNVTFTPPSVPEPSSSVLMTIAVALSLLARSPRKRSAL